MPKNLSTAPLPYSDFASRLLLSIHDALYSLASCHSEGKTVSDADINSIFSWLKERNNFSPSKGINAHLIATLEKTKKNSQDLPLRLTALTKHAFYEAQLDVQTDNKIQGVFLPSPLKILYDALTVPGELQSRAYSLLTCRTILLNALRVFPESSMAPHDGWEKFTPQDVQKARQVLRTYFSHGDNWEKPELNSLTNKINLFVAHFLAMKGILILKFGTERRIRSKEKEKNRLTYCLDGDLIATSLIYEFRKSPDYVDLPEHAELINQIWGVPVPIRGGDVIFFGGLRQSSDGSLVMSVSGAPGTGKTSLALALAAALSPLGTSTYYLTVEENPEDLKARLISLIPAYLRKLSIFRENTRNWFFIEKINFNNVNRVDLRGYVRKQLEQIQVAITSTKETVSRSDIPNPCPLLVVIDGLSIICEQVDKDATAYETLHTLIDQCRKLNVIVVLLSGEDNQILSRLDYLVDTVISLKYEGTKDVTDKPVRVMQITKTRQQISRPGSHVFHMSGDDGFRISPQLPSQLDKQQTFTYHLPDERQIIDTLNFYRLSNGVDEIVKFQDKGFLDLYHGSQILLHGHGSSGKASLALKILMTPTRLVHVNSQKRLLIRSKHPRRRILILSFLYPEDYYYNLENRLNKILAKEIVSYVKPRIEHMSFFPGFLTPEDLLGKIIRQLRSAEIEGEPYTGVLLDGLHNVFLQFPSLQRSTMIWPMIYSVLVRSKVTTLTTFTTFTLPISGEDHNEHKEMIIQGHIPFLHALVQATEFYLLLEPQDNIDGSRMYKLTIKEAFKQKVRTDALYWNREEMFFSI